MKYLLITPILLFVSLLLLYLYSDSSIFVSTIEDSSCIASSVDSTVESALGTLIPVAVEAVSILSNPSPSEDIVAVCRIHKESTITGTPIINNAVEPVPVLSSSQSQLDPPVTVISSTVGVVKTRKPRKKGEKVSAISNKKDTHGSVTAQILVLDNYSGDYEASPPGAKKINALEALKQGQAQNLFKFIPQTSSTEQG
jgi:hypothetical protein